MSAIRGWAYLILCLQLVSLGASADGLSDLFGTLKGGIRPASSGLLSPSQAFQVSARRESETKVLLLWRIAEGYYLYRDKFDIKVPSDSRFHWDASGLPAGEAHEDPEFGSVEIFRGDLELELPLGSALAREQRPFSVTLRFQGCADRGVCYPPMEETVMIAPWSGPPSAQVREQSLAPAVGGVAGECTAQSPLGFVETEGLSEECGIARTLERSNLISILLAFLGMGLLLSLTPCVFPMIPILSGIILGQKNPLSAGRSLGLSFIYVAASAFGYMIFGILAGLFGQNLQALFQEPWVIASFSAVFVVLALGMFDLYELSAPGTLQNWLYGARRLGGGGSPLGVAVMGLLSALIVGPCVAPPLAGALIYIGKTGDAWLGGAALFALGFGMGLPLLLFGLSAGRWLPKAGSWMVAIKATFGVVLLGNALWLLSRVIPPTPMLGLWAVFAITLSVFLGAFESVDRLSGWGRLRKGLGLALLGYGFLMLVGFATGGRELLMPLRGTFIGGGSPAGEKSVVPAFVSVSSLAELKHALRMAEARGAPALVDFYADWCVACKEMEALTFQDQRVLKHLSHWSLIRVDITKNTEEDRRLLSEFHLIGPPAVILYGPDGRERRHLRVIGFVGPNDFLNTLNQL